MQLTRYSDYSLRVLMYLAARTESLATIEEIATAYDISQGHVMKVIRGLVAEGFVESLRGRGGGVRLALPPEEIVLGDVVRATEENLALVECFSESSRCRIERACGLQGVLGEALDAFLGVLDDYTLADILGNRSRLSKLLQIA